MVVAIVALLAAACGDAPDDGDTGATEGATETSTEAATDEATDAAADFTACMVTDEGGVDDDSFNETSWAGVQRAEEELGVTGRVLESDSPSDYEPNIQEFLSQDCNIIVAVGFALAEAVGTAAENNPDQLFAIVDHNFTDAETGEDVTYENVRELTFATDEAAFLAGYVSAGMTETGTIGTYGGRPFPTVTIFMDGYLAGAEYYNAQNDANVEVLGWEGDPDTGQFTGDFTDQGRGRQITDQLLQNGADIIMPVAGPVGLGSAQAIQEAGEGKLVWVDTDGCESTDFCSLMLTSVMKNMDVAVFDSIEAAVNDEFEGGLYTGTLENEGVQIAPFHEYEDEVPQEITDQLDQIREQIIAGELSVDPADHGG